MQDRKTPKWETEREWSEHRAKFYLTLELIHMENCLKLLTAIIMYIKGYWLIEMVMFTKMTPTR
jgi:hypothetical protein